VRRSPLTLLSAAASWLEGQASPTAHSCCVDCIHAIPTDDRWHVTPTNGYPNRAVGQLEFDFDGWRYICSGSLIGESHVLTAAHCVHGGLDSGFATNMVFAPGRDGDDGNNNPYGVIDYETITTYTCWTEQYWPDNYNCDMAVVGLVS